MVKFMVLFLILFSSLFLFSCSKSGSGSSSTSDSTYITCNMDGVAKSFNNAVGADTLNVGGINSIDISGFTNNVNKETLHLNISNRYSEPGLPIVAGSYSDTSSGFDLSAYYLLVVSEDSTVQYGAGTSLAGLGDPIVNHLTIVITAIAGGHISGTFSGDYFLNGDPKAIKKTITGGVFYAPLQQ